MRRLTIEALVVVLSAAACPAQGRHGHGDFLGALTSIEARWPGLHVQGNFRGGPGVNDCIASGLALADRLG